MTALIVRMCMQKNYEVAAFITELFTVWLLLFIVHCNLKWRLISMCGI